MEHVVECFGWNRVMFGSDWPVCRLAGEYDQVLSALEEIVAPHLTPSREFAVFGDNTARFYGI